MKSLSAGTKKNLDRALKMETEKEFRSAGSTENVKNVLYAMLMRQRIESINDNLNKNEQAATTKNMLLAYIKKPEDSQGKNVLREKYLKRNILLSEKTS